VPRASIAMVFALLVSAWPIAFAQTPTSAESRWTVLIEAVDLPNPPSDKSECHPQQYFSENWKQFDYVAGQLSAYPGDAKDSVRSRRIGAVNGFEIDEVIHEISAGDNAPYPPPVIKMIVVEKMPGNFCEIFNEENSRENAGPSYLVDVDSTTILATHDQISGTCGCYNEAYWSFDNQGPILLHVDAYEIAQKLLGPGAFLDKGPQFDIQTLSFGPRPWRSANGASSDGYVLLKFALRDHQLVLVSQTINADPTEVFPSYGAPPERIKVDGAVQAQRLIKQIQPALPAAAQQAGNYPGGSVKFHAIIGKDGSVVSLAVQDCKDFPCKRGDINIQEMVRSGEFLLLQGQGANEIANAVRQWRYEPTLFDGYPIEVETTITVTFPPVR
jgi:hypothetical protein